MTFNLDQLSLGRNLHKVSMVKTVDEALEASTLNMKINLKNLRKGRFSFKFHTEVTYSVAELGTETIEASANVEKLIVAKPLLSDEDGELIPIESNIPEYINLLELLTK